ncbi:cell division control protein 45 [Guillardia theta CCMP2712]|uniref:Cell division control protein 45 n=2 Tax=Guillardia theta TaxID=55529 RepID=L1K0Q3_GUITC|nr:cell division control protein 45 [Guillardia theta CCMP2712]EKX54411.1 cell division control protein 45 [Guillardia theta CCMP2712]|eukprot:XP_005841391.1 cell division control protein 45 [Guillardia theta CCMP2712]
MRGPALQENWQVEFSVHKMSAAMMEDARLTFQHELEQEMEKLGVEVQKRKAFLVENLFAMPTWQPAPTWKDLLQGDWKSAKLDLSLYPNEEVNKVRKQMYNKIHAWSTAMRDALLRRGYWSNAACPITGNSMFGERTAHVYNELTGLTMMLGYDSLPVGCCGIVLHPQWGKAAYPMTFFTLAPLDKIIEAAEEIEKNAKLPDLEDQESKKNLNYDRGINLILYHFTLFNASKMLVDKNRIAEVYHLIKNSVRDEGSSVLICVAGECDAIAACHILVTMFRADHISYSLQFVRGYVDVQQHVDSLDTSSCRCIVLINCGSTEALNELLQLGEDDRADLQVVVIDSHRPYSLSNIYFDCGDVEDFENQDLSTARIILLDDGLREYEVPTAMMVVNADLNAAEEEEEEEEDEFNIRSPVQRRRIDEDGNSVDVDEEDEEKLEKQRKRQVRDECRLAIEDYYKGTSRGLSSAIMMYNLSTTIKRDNNSMLWWAMIGLTEQFMNDMIGRQRYEQEVFVLQDEAVRLGESSSVGGSKINYSEEFRFLLLQHWTLYNSMYYSNYVASRLGIWKDRTTNKLQTLLARMGIPLVEAEQRYMHMNSDYKDRLRALLEEHKEEFNLEELVFPTFRKERTCGNPISVTDCYYICSSMMYHPPVGNEDWTDSYIRSYDAIKDCAHHEDAWDVLVGGNSKVVQYAIQLQQTIVHKGFELAQDRMIQKTNFFRHAYFAVNEGNKILTNPAVLSRLAMFLMDLEKKTSDKELKPIVLGVDNEEDHTCTVVGCLASDSMGFRGRNHFGKIFKEAAEAMPQMEVQMYGFDTEVIQIKTGEFASFIDCIIERSMPYAG